MNINFLSRSS